MSTLTLLLRLGIPAGEICDDGVEQRFAALSERQAAPATACAIQAGTTIRHLGTAGSNPLAPTIQVGSAYPSPTRRAREPPLPTGLIVSRS